MADKEIKYSPGGPIPQTLYTCEHCGHKWKPRNPRPGDNIYCPNCGSFHSHRSGYLKPPKPRVLIKPGDPIKKKRSRPIKPMDKKNYVGTGIDQFDKKRE